MKLAPILVLCLAIAVHQTSAEPSIFDKISEGVQKAGAIAQGALDAATNVTQGVIGAAESITQGVTEKVNNVAQAVVGAATNITQGIISAGESAVSNLANSTSSLINTINEKIKENQGKISEAVLELVQDNLGNIQNATTGALQAIQDAAEKIEEGIQELSDKLQENINKWADQVKDKLANSSADTLQEGLELIEGFAEQRAQDLKTCTDQVVEELKKLDEKAKSTAQKYHEPLNKLVELVRKCSENKPNNFTTVIVCSVEIGEALIPLAGAAIELGAVEAQIVNSGLTNLKNNLCVASVSAQFSQEANSVDKVIDQLVADDAKNTEEVQPEDAPAN